jgi:hypothetical protein
MKTRLYIERNLEMLKHFDIDNSRVLFCPVWAPAIKKKKNYGKLGLFNK